MASQQVDTDDIIPDMQLDQGRDKSRPSSNSPAMPDNDSRRTRQQTTRAMTSATSLGVGVPENDNYDELLSINQAQSGQIQLLETTIRRLKTQLDRNVVHRSTLNALQNTQQISDPSTLQRWRISNWSST